MCAKELYQPSTIWRKTAWQRRYMQMCSHIKKDGWESASLSCAIVSGAQCAGFIGMCMTVNIHILSGGGGGISLSTQVVFIVFPTSLHSLLFSANIYVLTAYLCAYFIPMVPPCHRRIQNATGSKPLLSFLSMQGNLRKLIIVLQISICKKMEFFHSQMIPLQLNVFAGTVVPQYSLIWYPWFHLSTNTINIGMPIKRVGNIKQFFPCCSRPLMLPYF